MTPLEQRHNRLLLKYNLTEEQWEKLIGDNHCPACRKPFSSNRLPCVDHDHTTGLVRGILCTACNYAIGDRHDKVDWFARVASYLATPPALALIGRVFVPGSIGYALRWKDTPDDE